jgi:hypothetical protein
VFLKISEGGAAEYQDSAAPAAATMKWVENEDDKGKQHESEFSSSNDESTASK